MTKHAKAHLAAQAEAVGAPPPDDQYTTDTSVAALTAARPPPSEPLNIFSEVRTLTIPEAAAVLRINRNVAYAAARRGEIPTIKFGRAIRVPAVALQRLLGEAGRSPAHEGE